jgi:phytoene/squalene synthetase
MAEQTDPYKDLRVVGGQLMALLASRPTSVDPHHAAIHNLLRRVDEVQKRTANPDVDVAQRRIRQQLTKGSDANSHQVGADLANIAKALGAADDTVGDIQAVVDDATDLATTVAPFVAPLLLA